MSVLYMLACADCRTNSDPVVRVPALGDAHLLGVVNAGDYLLEHVGHDVRFVNEDRADELVNGSGRITP